MVFFSPAPLPPCSPALLFRRTPQLELERIDAAQDPLVQLLNHRGIAREAPQIEVLHFRDELLNLLLHRRIVLGCATELSQLVDPLLDRLLGVDCRRSLCGRRGSWRTGPGIVTDINVVGYPAVPIATAGRTLSERPKEIVSVPRTLSNRPTLSVLPAPLTLCVLPALLAALGVLTTLLAALGT